MSWMSRALCRTRPAEWWDTDSDGARLALALCSVCPTRTLCAGGRDREYGVIRAGVAWNARGEPAGLCGCGYPLPLGRPCCFRCDPPINPMNTSRRWPTERAAAARRLVAEGLSYVAVGKRLGVSKSMVAKYVARPQAVSTVVSG